MLSASAWAATPDSSRATPSRDAMTTAVLLVSHGSRSAAWRQALLDLEESVRDPILAGGTVQRVQTAFMEYTEPSIASRLRELDEAGFAQVIVVPVFLTISPHTFDDLPTILGIKEDPAALRQLQAEGIERYHPKASIRITPPLDFGDLLQRNVLRRVRYLSTTPAQEGLVLVAYGDATYEKEWIALLARVGTYVRQRTGIEVFDYGWCGHVVHYDPNATTSAISRVLSQRSTALLVPVLVAFDEMFQVKIIGDGIDRVPNARERVKYRPDAILPDPEVAAWVVEAATAAAQAN